MLFNTHSFIFIFLPITLLVFHLLSVRGQVTYALSSLIIASLVFYGWWEPSYLLLILLSIGVNFSLSEALARIAPVRKLRRKCFLWIGIALNLIALGWFKYANFLVDSSNSMLGTEMHLQRIILPLAISFFTFQQIAYLVDTFRAKTCERSFLHYVLFVTFFPQLIAGPIVHHKEMLPQFAKRIGGLKLQHIIIGGTIFFLGLFKKVIIADGVSPYSDTVFAMAANGDTLTFLESWTGALAYSIQLYFDFSGYSDMAIGLARMFGIRLPLNFNSPYKSRNIIEFWRRWHMTLSRFLRDYLYFPLGGNRHGAARTYTNLMIVMLLGGLWHGAGWTFVLWGALHGFYLLVNHAWRHFMTAKSADIVDSAQSNVFQKAINVMFKAVGTLASHAITLLAIIVAWVIFRAESVDVAGRVLAGMAGVNGVALPVEWLQSHASLASTLSSLGIQFQPLAYMGPLFTPLRDLAVLSGAQMQVDSVGTITALASLSVPVAAALFWPNTQQIMQRFEPAIGATVTGGIPSALAWRINIPFAILTAMMAAYACFGSSVVSQFLYFQF